VGPDPAVAAVRLAVRGALAGVPESGLVLAACSGGADSLALAAALAFEGVRSGRAAGGVTIDHGLQEGSAERAERVVRAMAEMGLDPAGSVAVTVLPGGGPENAARKARYAALDAKARELGATVFLGHTLNDQAETVLLGLARGSGARSLAGMPGSFVRAGVTYVRPLLNVNRATTRRACEAEGLKVWDDPHNEDPSYTRVRVRRDALPALERALGPGVPEALARTARRLREDADALDSWADSVSETANVTELAALPKAVRSRVLRARAVAAGCPPGALAAVHVEALDRLVTAWHGQRHTDLPGGVRAFRSHGMLVFA
jgi:tRNA(Ile)-lysidine synthase